MVVLDGEDIWAGGGRGQSDCIEAIRTSGLYHTTDPGIAPQANRVNLGRAGDVGSTPACVAVRTSWFAARDLTPRHGHSHLRRVTSPQIFPLHQVERGSSIESASPTIRVCIDQPELPGSPLSAWTTEKSTGAAACARERLYMTRSRNFLVRGSDGLRKILDGSPCSTNSPSST